MFGITIQRVKNTPAKPETVSTKPKAKKSAKPVNREAVVTTGKAIGLAMAAVGSALDGETVVPYVDRPLADLQTKVTGLRPNGTYGAHYPACFDGLTNGQVVDATEWLKARPTKSVNRPKGTPAKPEIQPAALTVLSEQVAALAAMVNGTPKPVVAEGHTMEPAKPETLLMLAEGQIVGFGNDLFEVAIAKNGKPFFRNA